MARPEHPHPVKRFVTPPRPLLIAALMVVSPFGYLRRPLRQRVSTRRRPCQPTHDWTSATPATLAPCSSGSARGASTPASPTRWTGGCRPSLPAWSSEGRAEGGGLWMATAALVLKGWSCSWDDSSQLSRGAGSILYQAARSYMRDERELRFSWVGVGHKLCGRHGIESCSAVAGTSGNVGLSQRAAEYSVCSILGPSFTRPGRINEPVLTAIKYSALTSFHGTVNAHKDVPPLSCIC